MKKGRTVRRKGALERLKAQLTSNTKVEKKTGKVVKLTEFDKKRIEKEIENIEKKKD